MRYRNTAHTPDRTLLPVRAVLPDGDPPWMAPSAGGLHLLAQPRLSARAAEYAPLARLAVVLFCLGQVGAWGGRIGALHTLAGPAPGRALLWLIAIGFAAMAQSRFSRFCYGARAWTGIRAGALAATFAQGALAFVLCAATIATALPHLSTPVGLSVISVLCAAPRVSPLASR